MKTNYFFNPAVPAHGVDITTDTGERFGIACPDEPTARTIAATEAALQLLEKVANWELPDTDKTWDDGTPMSYTAAFGTNGARDYFKGLARLFLNNLHAEK